MPGNIRELENAIEHAYIRSKTNRIENEALPHSITESYLKEIEILLRGELKGKK